MFLKKTYDNDDDNDNVVSDNEIDDDDIITLADISK